MLIEFVCDQTIGMSSVILRDLSLYTKRWWFAPNYYSLVVMTDFIKQGVLEEMFSLYLGILDIKVDGKSVAKKEDGEVHITYNPAFMSEPTIRHLVSKYNREEILLSSEYPKMFEVVFFGVDRRCYLEIYEKLKGTMGIKAVRFCLIQDVGKVKIQTPLEKALEFLDNVKTTLQEKNKAYGDSAANPLRIFSKSDSDEAIKVRIDDKLSRIAKGDGSGNEDAIKDLVGYLALLAGMRK